jgi:hypothetical protein
MPTQARINNVEPGNKFHPGDSAEWLLAISGYSDRRVRRAAGAPGTVLLPDLPMSQLRLKEERIGLIGSFRRSCNWRTLPRLSRARGHMDCCQVGKGSVPGLTQMIFKKRL